MKKYWKERKKKQELKNQKEIEDYEENLKLHYESKRKELDIILSSSLPHQINNIKMVLWVNFLFLGLAITVSKIIHFTWIFYSSFACSIIAVICMLIALMRRRSKMYGSIDQLDYVDQEIKDGIYAKSTMLSGLVHNAFEAVEYNRETLQILAKYLRKSIICTTVAIGIFFSAIIYTNIDSIKEIIHMSDKKERPKPSEVQPPQRPIHEAEERSIKPSEEPRPEPKTEKK